MATRFVALLRQIVRPAVAVLAAGLMTMVLTACQPSNPKVTLSNVNPSASNVTYDFQADGNFNGFGCLTITFSVSADGTGGLPPGMDLSAAQVVAVPGSNATNWSGSSTSGDNSTGIVKVANVASSGQSNSSTYHVGISGLKNGSAPQVDYTATGRFYDAADCSGSILTDAPIVVRFHFGIDASSSNQLSTQVAPTLTFTTANHVGSCNGVAQSSMSSSCGSAVDLGRIGVANGVGAQALTVTTNAAAGFTVYLRSTSAIVSASGQSITSVAGTNAMPAAFPNSGTEAFGYTTSDSTLGTGTINRFTSGGTKWAAATMSDAEVSAAASVADVDAVCVAYQAGVSSTATAGTYSTNIIYTAVARF